jgi:hypothetical protein
MRRETTSIFLDLVAALILAGLIHKVGLLSPQQNNLAGAALTAYKQFSSIAGQQEDQVSDGDDEHGESSSPTRDDRSFPIRTDRLDKVADDQIRRCLGYRCKRYRAEAR